MASATVLGTGIALLTILVISLIAFLYQLTKQQGRLLLRLDQVERRLGIDPAQSIDRESVRLQAREAAPKTALKKLPLSESRIERDGLEPGTPAPRFTLPDIHGGTVSLDQYRGRKVLLVFSDPHCGPCEQVAPHLSRLHAEHRNNGLSVLMIGRGDPEENRCKAAEHGVAFPVALQRKWEISRQYGIYATPVGFLIDENGVIAEDVARGSDQIVSLARKASRGEGRVAHA